MVKVLQRNDGAQEDVYSHSSLLYCPDTVLMITLSIAMAIYLRLAAFQWHTPWLYLSPARDITTYSLPQTSFGVESMKAVVVVVVVEVRAAAVAKLTKDDHIRVSRI
jgi:hypothetical protein